MAIIVKKAAVGNSPSTGTPRTPTGRVFVSGPELAEKSPPVGYGGNHYTGPSSAMSMDKIPESPMARSLRLGSDDDGVLDTLISKGSARGDEGDLGGSSQLRTVSDKMLAPSMGMARQQIDYDKIGKNSLPSKNGASPVDDSASRYGQGRKRAE